MKISPIEATLLDKFHIMCKAYWRSTYQKKDKKEVTIEFSVIYFKHLNEELKVFAYITGDEQKLLKKHGLV